MTRREAIRRAVALSGFTLTSPALLAVLEGCQVETTLSWEPQVLTQPQVKLVGSIANRILPPTHTPGALDVGVDRFIDTMLHRMFSEKERQVFLRRLDDFSLQEADFADATEAVQDQKLLLLEQTYAKAPAADPDTPKPFFRTLKELTLLGYFTSEAVMTKQLNYHAVAGKYEGCVPLAEEARQYVDNNV